MGCHFSAMTGFAPAQLLQAPPSDSASVDQFLSSTEIELVLRYATPLEDDQRKRLPKEPPDKLIPANVLKIDGGEINWVEAIARFLVYQGHPIVQARSMADVAMALSDFNKTRPGPKRKPPRLYPNAGYIWMTDGVKRKSTGYPLSEVKDFTKHIGANAKLSVMLEKRVREILGRVLRRDVTISEMFTTWLMHNKPGRNPHALSEELYGAVCNHLQHLEDFMGENTLNDLGYSTGTQYMEWATAQQIKSQSEETDLSEVRYVARATARLHLQTLVKVERWYCEQLKIESTKIKIPTVPRHAVAYLTFEEIVRLISAARGRIYNAAGEVIGHHDKSARYECVVRFIIIYLYGGTRHANILLLTWFQDLQLGHINPDLGIIERQGSGAEITNKRKNTSNLIGSLIEMSLGWRDEDEAKRKQFPGRYIHIIHDEFGEPIANKDAKRSKDVGKRMTALFREVKELAALPHVRPHMLKHSGVTFAVRAGMPMSEVSLAFSTSPTTLWIYYVHLRPLFACPGVYDPAKLKLLALRRLSSAPMPVCPPSTLESDMLPPGLLSSSPAIETAFHAQAA